MTAHRDWWRRNWGSDQVKPKLMKKSAHLNIKKFGYLNRLYIWIPYEDKRSLFDVPNWHVSHYAKTSRKRSFFEEVNNWWWEVDHLQECVKQLVLLPTFRLKRRKAGCRQRKEPVELIERFQKVIEQNRICTILQCRSKDTTLRM